MRRRYNELASEVPQIYGEVDSLQQRLANNKRLQVARSDFLKCEQQSSASSDPPSSFSKGGDKEALCYAARQALQALITPDGTRNIPSEQQRQEQMVI